MRVPLIIANWKLYKTVRESLAFTDKFLSLTGRFYDRDIVLCPPFTAIYSVAKALEGTSVKTGAQNVSYSESGAYTGEVSPEMLREAGCKYVIIGHSERRKYFGETDEMINRKIRIADSYGLVPVICTGEREEERNKGKTREVLEKQILHAIKDFNPSQIEKFVIAYEPVWAIGTGYVATPELTVEVVEFLRHLISTKHTYSVASKVRILYGGSVKPENSQSFLREKEIDGLLVGGASLDPESFYRITGLA